MWPALPEFRDPVCVWTHFGGFAASVLGTVALVALTRDDGRKRIAMLVYGGTMAAAYAASTIYHAADAPPEQLLFLRKLDHAAIYLMIAGTNTPIQYALFPGPLRWTVLAPMWVAAGVGVAAKFLFFDLPEPITMMLYVGMGWAGAAGYLNAVRLLPPAAIQLVLAGGMFYTLGAVIDFGRWAGPASHAVFHFFVLGGSLMFYLFILLYIVPFPRADAPECRAAEPGSAAARRAEAA